MFQKCKNGVVLYAGSYPIEDISSEINCPEFRKAYYYDSANDESLRKSFKGITIKNYWSAFNQGHNEAGVNLMRIYFLDLQELTLIYEKIDLPGYKRKILELEKILDELSAKLLLVNHPIVPFYEKLNEYFRHRNDPFEQTKAEFELWFMEDENKYAEAMFEDLDEYLNSCMD